MAIQSGYVSGSPAAGGTATSAPQEKATGYWTLEQCKQAYLDYTGVKQPEEDERKEARRYRHHSQWTAAQIKTLNDRKQPVVTYPRIGRKIDGIVGTVERLKQDPKAYPRTPQQEQGAELATAALRYAMESQQWEAKTPIAADNCATDGHSGIELELIEGDHEDKEIGFNLIEDGFFYDPRSFRLDFSDARYHGVSKLLDVETAIDLLGEDHEEEIRNATETGGELATNSDRENRWFMTVGKRKFIRLCDLWYKHKGGWCWALFTGSKILDEGKSFFFDEKKKPISKFIMFRCAVDQDGDSYGFVRALKSSQDEINQRRSKGLHILNTRRIIAERGAFDDIEVARKEAAKPDGVVEHNKGFEAEFDDQAKQLDLTGQIKFLEDAKAEIDNYGPSQVVTGEGVDGQSGRAIALRQTAALAELGPFILSHRSWKLRVYRAVFCAIQRYWTGERWIRVTDDQGVAQFVQINGQQVGPDGQTVMVNAIGSLDVDVILDEGPDTINAAADTNEVLKEVIPAVANVMPPPKLIALVDAYVETSTLASEVKQKYRKASQQMENQPPPPDPEMVKAEKEMQLKAQVAQTDAQLQAQKQQTDAQLKTQETEQEIRLAREKAQAELQLKREIAEQELALKAQTMQHDAHIKQQSMQHDAQIKQETMQHDAQLKGEQMQHEQKQQKKKFTFEANLKRKEAGQPPLPDEDEELKQKVDSEVMQALQRIEELTAQAHKAAAAPRRTKLIRDAKGRPVESVSTIEAD